VTRPSIRLATADDVDVLVRLQRDASVTALAHIFPPADHPFPEDSTRDRWRDFRGTILLATVADEPVGMVGIEPPWLEGLYVVPTAWGTGVADALHDDAVEALRAGGVSTGRLWVLEHNARARRFYERHGWRADGTTRVVPFPPHPTDVGYSRSLTP
jgi:GNAT superfamily N-acetyltransferase